MSRNIIILQGGEDDIQIQRDDPEAVSVTFVMKNDDTDALTEITEAYAEVDGTWMAQITIDGLHTSIIGVYSYQINENISGGGIRKHGVGNCAEWCEFGKLIICESLDGVVS